MRQLLRSALRDDFVEILQTGLFVERGEIARWVVSELLELLYKWETGGVDRVVIVMMGERTRRWGRSRRRSYWNVERGWRG